MRSLARLTWVSLLSATVAVFCYLPAWADLLELKNGQKIEGQYAGGSKGEVRFDVGSQALKFPVAEVSRITIGAAGQAEFEKAAKDVLRQLKALASVAEGGVTYRDYAPRVTDAKIKVDQFLEEYKASPVPKFNEDVSDSLGYYLAASSAWSAKVSSSGYIELARNPYVLKCTEVQTEISKYRRMASQGEEALEYGITVSLAGISPLWQCAKKLLTEAEATLKP